MTGAPHTRRASGWEAFGTHYIRDIVYAANDGIITTFAAVAGVRGAELAAAIVLVMGFANLASDGLSMALGNFLGIKSEQASKLKQEYVERVETIHAAKHAAITWLSFVLAGLVPLVPYFLTLTPGTAFRLSVVLTAATLFAVGAGRSVITTRPWVRSGLEMLLVGGIAGAAGFAAGFLVDLARR